MWWSRLRPLSIRLRLLLLLLGGLGVLMLGLFLLLDHGLDQQIYGRLDQGLRARAHAISVLLETRPARDALDELQAMSPEFGGGGHTDFLQLWDASGHTLLSSDSNRDANLTPPRQVPANAPYFYDLTLPDGHHGRAVAVRVTLQGQRGDAILTVAEERERVDALERRVHVALVSGVILTTLMAIALAFLAVRSGLRPLLAFGGDARDRAETADLEPGALPSELRPLAHALNGAFGGLRRALQRERRFARDVAHELRTPLAEIRTAVELARREPQASPALEGALDSAERMARCIDGLLALSRYESGMQEVHREPVELKALLERSLQLASGPAQQRGVHMDLEAPAECWVQSDPVMLERVLDNLLLNAAEHAMEGSRVQVRLSCDRGRIDLGIGNRAPDLGHDDLERLGERFWRKSPAREASGHGGLGLSLARSLAELLELRLDFRLDGDWLWAELGGLSGIDTHP